MKQTFMNRFRERRYLVLLLILVLTIVVQPLAGRGLAGLLIYGVLRTLVVLIVFFVVFQRQRDRLLALVLGLPVLTSQWTPHLLPDRFGTAQVVMHHSFLAAFLGFAVAMILRGIFERKAVQSDDVIGAICGYLLAGIVWGTLYLLVELLSPGSFSVNQDIAGHLASRYARLSLFADYSFMTLTSLGSADMTPSSAPAISLTWLEAIFGQFYIAVIVAQLVGLRLAQALQQKELKSE